MGTNEKKNIVNPDTEDQNKPVIETTGEDLKYNEEADSFELDPETGDGDYQHPSPYDTSAPSGQDDNSTYDEQNPYTQDEYKDEKNVLEKQFERSEADRVLESRELDTQDELLADTDEVKSPEEDEEGYPKKDDAGGKDNPIV